MNYKPSPFSSAFNGFLKVAFQGSRITSDAGLILIRELDERLGLATLIAEHLSDLGPIGDVPPAEFEAQYYEQAAVA